MQELGPAPPVPDKKQLIAQLQDALKKVIAEDVRGAVDREKVYQYSQARRNDLYFRGLQNLVPVMLNGSVADWAPVNGSITSIPTSTSGNPTGAYDSVVNDVRSFGDKYIAVLGQRAPNVKAMPNRSDDEQHKRLSRRADIEAKKLRNQWQLERKHRLMVLSLYKNGTTFVYTPYVSNGDRYGWIEAPAFGTGQQPVGSGTYHCMFCGHDTPEDMQPQACEQCGQGLSPESYQPAPMADVPVPQEPKKYPKGAVEFHVASVFEVTCPFWAKDLTEAPYLLYEYEADKYALISSYPNLEEKLQASDGKSGDSGGMNSSGRLARDSASSPQPQNISPRKNRCLYSRLWIKPYYYNAIRDKSLRDLAKQNFPSGLKITAVDDEIVDLEEEFLEDVWAMAKPRTSEYMFADAHCTDYIEIQDLVNDVHNLQLEIVERAIPWFAYDPKVFSKEVLQKRAQLVAEMVPTISGMGGQLQNSIWKAPTAEPDVAISNWIDKLRDHGATNLGIVPQLYGAGEGREQTALEANQKRNAALQMLSTPWNEMRSCYEQAFFNGVRQAAKYVAAYQDDQLDQIEMADLAELQNPGWHMEAEESMPMTWGQKRDLLWSLITTPNPQTWDLLSMNHADNKENVHEIFGIPEWTIAGLNAREKVFDTIAELLKSKPVESLKGWEPSIPIDAYEDDHELCDAVVKEWAQSQKGRAAKKSNIDGYKNVMAWGLAHAEFAAPPPPGEPGSGPGGPGASPANPPSGGPPGPSETIPQNPSALQLPPPSGTQPAKAETIQ